MNDLKAVKRPKSDLQTPSPENEVAPFPFWESSKEDFLSHFSNGRYIKINKNAYLFRENDPPQGIFCICEGVSKLARTGKNGKEYIIRFAQPGDWLGVSGIYHGTHISDAVAIEPVKSFFVPKDEFIRFLNRNSQFSLNVMKILCDEIEKAENRITALAQKTARERVAEILLNLQQVYGIDNNKYLNILLTRKDLANFVGISNATLSRLMSDFQRKKLIRIKNKKIRLLDLKKLSTLARIAAV